MVSGKLKRLYPRGRAVWDAVMRDEITTRASSFAYHMVLAIPPLIILTFTIAAVISELTDLDTAASLQHQIRRQAPPATRALLLSLVTEGMGQARGGGASLGIVVTLVLALWSGSNAIAALLQAFNLAYGVEETRGFIQRLRLRLILTILIILAINIGVTALLFGQRVGRSVADAFERGDRFDRIWNALTIPAGIAAIALLLAVLYYAGPNVDLSFRWVSPGSILATALWVGVTALLGVYLRLFNTGSAYGAVGSVIVLLVFLYLTGWTFLLGAKVNAEVGRRYDPRTIADLATSDKALSGLRASARRRFRNWLSKGAPRPRPDS
jgi:membrane protein